MSWYAEAPQGNEAAKIKYEIVKYTRGRGLDLGCGPFKAFPHFIGVDNGHHAEEFGWQFKPDMHVDDCADLSVFNTESMDFVFSSHLLEHIDDFKSALKEWWRVLKVGGHLVLYLPHKDLYPNIGQPGANPDHKHDFGPLDISDAMKEVAENWELLVSETRDGGIEYSFFQVYKKGDCFTGQQFHNDPGKDMRACVVRYGGFGDMLQAAALLPELKRQGYHITMMTTPKGQDILKHDPHIDDWYIQDKDQVPNQELNEFWKVQERHFAKFINLSESIEGNLLAIPGRANHAWPNEIRHKYLNKNYMEFTFELARVPFHVEPRFYPSGDEIATAERIVAGHGAKDKFRIMWPLAGSSIHKFYPHMDAVIASIMLEMPDAMIFTVGDEACRLLEQGWELEPRVLCMSGNLNIRETLTLALDMHCVVGPETGVLNAVAYEQDIAKVVMLSHSSHENLTRDWPNTTSISAPFDPNVPICNALPCHRLHYGDEYCPTDPNTGAAACATLIDPQRVFESIKVTYETWKDNRTVPAESRRYG